MDQQTITWMMSSGTTIAAGLLGAYFFHRLALVRENEKFEKEQALREAEEYQALVFISIELVFLLESFAETCAEVAFDEPMTIEGKDHYEITLPEFDLSPVKGDWRVLEPTVMYGIRSLPAELSIDKNLRYQLNRDFGEGDDEYCCQRQLGFALLGRKALTLAIQLRINSELPDNSRNQKLISDLEPVIERLEKAEVSD